MKKVMLTVLLPLILVILLFGIFTLFLSPEKKEFTTLSERSLAYIKTQKDKESPFWVPVNFSGPGSQQSKVLGTGKIRINHCFAFEPSLSIRTEKILDTCAYKYYFNEPNGFMTIVLKQSGETNLDEISAITFRRLGGSAYTEREYKTAKYSFLVFKKNSDSYEQTAFRLDSGKLFTMSYVVSSNQNMDKEFYDVLSSVDFLY